MPKPYNWIVKRKDGGSFIVQAWIEPVARAIAVRRICGLHGKNAYRSKKYQVAKEMIESVIMESSGETNVSYIRYGDGTRTEIKHKTISLSKTEQFALFCMGADEMVKLGIMTESERVEAIKKRGKELGI